LHLQIQGTYLVWVLHCFSNIHASDLHTFYVAMKHGHSSD